MKLETVKLQTVKLQTVKLETVKLETVKLETVKLQTVKLQTVKLQNMKLETMKLEIVRFSAEEHLPLLDAITDLLHQAYGVLAEQGMHYMASHQPPAKTLERLQEGEGYLFFAAGDLAGTVSLQEGSRKPQRAAYYERAGVYLFSQFAIRPALQGRGLGSRVMNFLEGRARQLGARELALDTSERATALIEMYRKRGYRIVSEHRWPDVNYRSVIMSKLLAAADPAP